MLLVLMHLARRRDRMGWALAAALLAGACLRADAAHAAEPILDDLDRARTLAPPPGALSGIVEETKGPEGPAVAREVALLVVHGRYTTVPAAFLEIAFSEHTSLASPSFGVAYEWGDLDGSMWAVELDWTGYVPEAGNWLEKDTPPAGASYVENGLQLISIDASYRRHIPFTHAFRGLVGGGLGLGVLLGDFDIAEVLPTCEQPVQKCPHWPAATNDTADLPTRVVPIVHLTLGLEVDLPEGFLLRAQGGFRNAMYVGLSLGKTL